MRTDTMLQGWGDAEPQKMAGHEGVLKVRLGLSPEEWGYMTGNHSRTPSTPAAPFAHLPAPPVLPEWNREDTCSLSPQRAEVFCLSFCLLDKSFHRELMASSESCMNKFNHHLLPFHKIHTASSLTFCQKQRCSL